MEVLILVGLVIYGGYRLIKSSTPAARREKKRQEEASKEFAAALAEVRNEFIENHMKAHNVDRETAEGWLSAAEAQQRSWEQYKRENPGASWPEGF